mmetsp:Transcript_5121/g.11721  ORF Transcript_5121/g.11721 Transcript_5121/m.11721 type:complete len:284 (-) Transcript_5121:69-920(-)
MAKDTRFERAPAAFTDPPLGRVLARSSVQALLISRHPRDEPTGSPLRGLGFWRRRFRLHSLSHLGLLGFCEAWPSSQSAPLRALPSGSLPSARMCEAAGAAPLPASLPSLANRRSAASVLAAKASRAAACATGYARGDGSISWSSAAARAERRRSAGREARWDGSGVSQPSTAVAAGTSLASARERRVSSTSRGGVVKRWKASSATSGCRHARTSSSTRATASCGWYAACTMRPPGRRTRMRARSYTRIASSCCSSRIALVCICGSAGLPLIAIERRSDSASS